MEMALFGLRVLAVVALYAFFAVLLWALLRERRAEPPALPAAQLIALDNEGVEGRRYEVQSTAWIGRDPNCLARAEDDFTSARHAQVLWNAGDQSWWLEDNLSRNGTFLNDNDQRITRAQLKDGDVIRAGRARFRFRMMSDEGEQVTR
jgi:pSer/pThr/pTyr-binding forkhead associated (FHA) protein